MLFVRLFDLCLFGFVGFLFLLGSGKAAVCDSGTPRTFLLPFFFLIFPIIVCFHAYFLMHSVNFYVFLFSFPLSMPLCQPCLI